MIFAIKLTKKIGNMSLHKAIKHKKEKRKEYTKSKSIDSTCRNHGSCPWCKNNRLYSDKKRRLACLYQYNDTK